MPLIKGKSKKSFDKNMETEMDSGKPKDQALAIAYSVQRKNKRKKMAEGGTVGDLIGYPKRMAEGGMIDEELKEDELHLMDSASVDAYDAEPKKMYDERDPDRSGPAVKPMKMMADGGMLAEEDAEMKHASLAAAIMAKRAKAKMMAEGGEVDLQANSNENLNMEDQLSFDAARKDTYYDLSQLDEQPEDSNEHSDDIDSDKHDMVSSIRKKMRAKRGL